MKIGIIKIDGKFDARQHNCWCVNRQSHRDGLPVEADGNSYVVEQHARCPLRALEIANRLALDGRDVILSPDSGKFSARAWQETARVGGAALESLRQQATELGIWRDWA